MEDKTIMKLMAIGSLTILESINMIIYHIDGTVLSLFVGAICGLAGYQIGQKSKSTE